MSLHQVGRTRWVDALAQFNYWRRHPPTHELVAAFIGFKPPAEAEGPPHSVDPNDPSGIGAMIAAAPNGFYRPM